MKKFLIEHENGFLFSQAIFTITGLFMSFYTILLGEASNATYACVVLYVLLAIYTCWSFKKPHGNFIKYIGLILSATIIYTALTVVSPVEEIAVSVSEVQEIDNILTFTFLLAAMAIAYVSGRLDKYKSNTVILIIVIVALVLAVTYYQNVINTLLESLKASQQVSFAIHFCSYNPPIVVATFGISYLTRYEPHIQAGIEFDKQEQK